MDLPTGIVTLAQLFEPPIPSVPPAPLLERWVTGSGQPGAGLLAALGVVALLALPRAGKARWTWPAALACWALAAGVLITGRVVVTPREELRAAAADLVGATVTADTARLQELLAPDARVRTRMASAEGRDNILPLVGRVDFRIESHDVRSVRVDLRGPRVARTQIRVSLRSDTLPPASWWAVDWQRLTTEDPWTVTLIEPLWIQGMTDPAGP